MFLLGHQDIHGIEEDLWDLVDNLSEFNKYPWAERVYEATIPKRENAFKSYIKPKLMTQVLV
ncbi:hypothetical protein MKW92_049286, partial [Papaver armeniacum]